VRILLSNDDGYQAPGLRVLRESLIDVAQITVVAPDRNRSGASNSLTLERPLRIHESAPGVLYVDGTPTDCVHVAITGLLKDEPDMVVSGINAGANMGDDIIYSGTVAAAIEGRYLGLPAIAISLASRGAEPVHYATAGHVALQLVERLRKDPLPADTILNVNVPDLPLEEIRGFAATRLGRRHRAEPVIKSEDPRGRPIYWVGAAGTEADAGGYRFLRRKPGLCLHHAGADRPDRIQGAGEGRKLAGRHATVSGLGRMADPRTEAGLGMTSRRTRERLRQRLQARGIRHPQVLELIGRLPRHLFVDEALASRAYEDIALPLMQGQTISQPYIVARMTEALLDKGRPRKAAGDRHRLWLSDGDPGATG